MSHRAVIGVGSNIAPRENVDRALEMLRTELTVLAESNWVWTDPIGRPGQDRYLNGAVLVETDLSAEGLEARLHLVESRLGRVRGADRYEPRTIDLDLVVYDGRVVDTDVYERDFLRRAVEEVGGSVAAGGRRRPAESE